MVAELEDSALLKAFGFRGVGAFPAAAIIEGEVRRQYGVRPLGQAEDVKESYFAITVERRIKHPAVVAISARARAALA